MPYRGCFKHCAACRNMLQFAVQGQDLLDERDCPWHLEYCLSLESCRHGFHLPSASSCHTEQDEVRQVWSTVIVY